MKGGLATSAFSPAAFLNTRSGMLLFGQLDLILTIAFAKTTHISPPPTPTSRGRAATLSLSAVRVLP